MIGLAAIAGIAGKVLDWANKRADTELETARIKAGVTVEDIKSKTVLAGYAKELTQTAMGHKVFWIVWSIFAFPLAIWWALAMAGTVRPLQGLVPVVEALNVVLKPYADQIFATIFYSGAGVAGLQTLGDIAKSVLRR